MKKNIEKYRGCYCNISNSVNNNRLRFGKHGRYVKQNHLTKTLCG